MMIEMASNTILVQDFMTTDVVSVTKDCTLDTAAQLMRDHKIGSVIVLEDLAPIGIVTERDMLVKAVAKDVAPDQVTVSEIMNAPVMTTTPRTEILEAARQMAAMRIRRMPVVNGGAVVGIITENDILRITPDLVEITRELRLNGGTTNTPVLGSGQLYAGACDNCGQYSEELRSKRGRLLCDHCRELQS